MKFSKVQSICKKAKRIQIGHDADETIQLIGDGFALYKFSDLPRLSEQEALALLDVGTKAADDWSCMRAAINHDLLLDYMDEDAPARQYKTIISHRGVSMVVFESVYGLMFINENYLSPMEGYIDQMDFFHRKTKSCDCIVAKVGFFMSAVIAPMNYDNKRLTEELAEILAGLKLKQLEDENKANTEWSKSLFNNENNETSIFDDETDAELEEAVEIARPVAQAVGLSEEELREALKSMSNEEDEQ